jgi:hypothetical protein
MEYAQWKALVEHLCTAGSTYAEYVIEVFFTWAADPKYQYLPIFQNEQWKGNVVYCFFIKQNNYNLKYISFILRLYSFILGDSRMFFFVR